MDPGKDPSPLVLDTSGQVADDTKTATHNIEGVSVCEPEPDNSRDANVIDWDGPDDHENPLNWKRSKVVVTLALISAVTFLSSLASSIFAPGIPQILDDFKSTNSSLGSFIVSVFVIGYAFGPLVIAPLSEIYGRLPLYLICSGFFIITNIACALAPSLSVLAVFRLFAGLAGSCPLVLSAGTTSDLIPHENRGKVTAVFNIAPLLGPIVGPIGGGYLIQHKGWRWSFWLVTIVASVIFILSLAFLHETYAYAILNRKANRLRKETGNQHLRSVLDEGRSPKRTLMTAIIRPTKMLVCAPIILLISLLMFLFYGYFYLLFTAMPILLAEQYGFSTSAIGLTYIGPGVGSLIGVLFSGLTSDKFARHLKKVDGESKPEHRIHLFIGASLVIPVGLFWTGWTAASHQHWILPIIGTSTMSTGVILAFVASTTYLIDAYGVYAASALAATTVLRSLGGALLPLAGGPMFSGLGFGWGSSLLAFIAVAMIPVPIIILKYGERIRRIRLFDVKF
ncbi:MFS general substrate transporter [Lojkania enalia]|uniref:MFS general substrate transporter n=1 Tax=Lojkania enalia TaxID=147567 RepID=A0A9P4JZD0_9PLEO|nr:MFS general substrate transporter [Didymosphaeria enalia]